MNPTIEHLGEFGLIDQIKKWVGPLPKKMVGIGDDCAIFQTRRGVNQLITIDSLVENVDFVRKQAAPEQIGWKALAVNLSDIAAMGAVPKVAIVSLSLPAWTEVNFVRGFYRGLMRLARRFQVYIVGGDLSKGPVVSSAIAVLGESKAKLTIYRNRAKSGDLVCVTGKLGGSILGKHLDFVPRIKEGQFLARQGVSAMIDISDGLYQDLKHVADDSQVGAVVDERRVPVSKAALKLAHGDPKAAREHALTDGEDFELLFTVPEARFYPLERAWKSRFRIPLTPIGKIVAHDNATFEMRKRLGFQHF